MLESASRGLGYDEKRQSGVVGGGRGRESRGLRIWYIQAIMGVIFFLLERS